jgi:Site-specific recombinases, DNA invertase Pin homologs
MIFDSAAQQFQIVLVYQLDRFARSRHDSALYKHILKNNGVRVVSARENITEDASGILLEALLEGQAEYYSAELAQKISRGMGSNADKGLSTGGGIALGYKLVKIDPTKEKSKMSFRHIITSVI